MALTKAKIVNSIQNQFGFPQNQLTDIIETLLEIIKRSLESGDDVLISGFGKFCVKEKNERRGRNPATGEDIPCPEGGLGIRIQGIDRLGTHQGLVEQTEAPASAMRQPCSELNDKIPA